MQLHQTPGRGLRRLLISGARTWPAEPRRAHVKSSCRLRFYFFNLLTLLGGISAGAASAVVHHHIKPNENSVYAEQAFEPQGSPQSLWFGSSQVPPVWHKETITTDKGRKKNKKQDGYLQSYRGQHSTTTAVARYTAVKLRKRCRLHFIRCNKRRFLLFAL